MMSSKTPSEKGNSLKPDDILENSLTKPDDDEKSPINKDASSSNDKENDNKPAKDGGKDKSPERTLPSKEDKSKEHESPPDKPKTSESLEKDVMIVNGESASSSVSGSDKKEFLPFPGISDLNGRLRRLISSFQREKQKEMARQAAIDKRNERRERIEQVIREREQQKLEMLQKRWNRREENEFFRTLVAYGVNFNTKTNKHEWERFKQLSKLDKKFDETLTEYYEAFLDMCETITGKKTKSSFGRYLCNLVVSSSSPTYAHAEKKTFYHHPWQHC